MQRSKSSRYQNQVNAEPWNVFYKRSLGAIAYVLLSAMVALLLAYWPASAGDILARLKVVPTHLTSVVPDRTHKGDRNLGMSFDQRWSAVPALSNQIRTDNDQQKQPRVEGRIEKIPFSCELAFSRVITKGNFSTRCMARVDGFGELPIG
jgi:hypothetical protein